MIGYIEFYLGIVRGEETYAKVKMSGLLLLSVLKRRDPLQRRKERIPPCLSQCNPTYVTLGLVGSMVGVNKKIRFLSSATRRDPGEKKKFEKQIEKGRRMNLKGPDIKGEYIHRNV